jgi:Rrf2 family protein
MTISLKGEYALRAMFDLASHHSATPVRAADIARGQEIPAKFLELILSTLRQGGLIESRRGADGGYRLARHPETITVGEVLRLIEGHHKPKSQRADRYAGTPFSATWRRIDESVSAILDRTHFAQLQREWTERQKQYVPDWEI